MNVFLGLMQLKCIDFFAGIGAWELASKLVNQISQMKFETIEFIEINPQAQKVLRSHFPEIPIYSDVRSYEPKLGEVDVYFCSFPCTDTSAAGKKEGLAGEESRLWFEALRCIIIGRPTFVVVENPSGLIDRGLRTVIAGLRMAGYETEVEIISASECGAPHQRQRVFIIAYADSLCLRKQEQFCCWFEQIGEHVAIAKSLIPFRKTSSSSMCVDDGIPDWLDGIRFDGWWLKVPQKSGIARFTKGRRECVSLYGKSIVPLQAAIALMRVQFLASITGSSHE
jgi:DNA (cytosine-5)-methyltransferase 1